MTTAPGWYPDPTNGHTRWWDGTQWGAFAPPPAAPAVKDMTLSYVLWVFLGFFGVHNFYLRNHATGAAQLGIYLVGWAAWTLGLGWVFHVPLFVWWVVDAFLIPGFVRKANWPRV